MMLILFLYFQLSIPEDLDEITTGLVKAIDRAVDNEDQSEQNLNLILKIMTNIADYCRNDNVSTNSKRFCLTQEYYYFVIHIVHIKSQPPVKYCNGTRPGSGLERGSTSFTICQVICQPLLHDDAVADVIVCILQNCYLC